MEAAQQVIQSARERRLIRFVPRDSFWTCVHGVYGSKAYIFSIKEDFKKAGFRYTRKISGGTKNGKATLREELNVLSADATTTASNVMINFMDLSLEGDKVRQRASQYSKLEYRN